MTSRENKYVYSIFTHLFKTLVGYTYRQLKAVMS